MGLVYRKTLMVLFMGLFYLLCFVLLFEPSLRIGFLNRVLRVEFMGRNYGSYFTVSNFMSVLLVIISVWVYARIYR